MNKAVVVFLGKKSVDDPAWYARWLKPGFVHCFVLVEKQGEWVKVEGARGKLDVTYLGKISDAAAYYEGTTVATTVRYESLRSPWIVGSCVGLTKSVLGIRSFALTPWQLYKYLSRDATKEIK